MSLAPRTKAWLGAAATLALATTGLWFGYLLLGWSTGVFVMCATAPEWWQWAMRYVVPWLLAAVAVGLASIVYRRFSRHSAAAVRG
jgi:hypothetical protein